MADRSVNHAAIASPFIIIICGFRRDSPHVAVARIRLEERIEILSTERATRDRRGNTGGRSFTGCPLSSAGNLRLEVGDGFALEEAFVRVADAQGFVIHAESLRRGRVA